MFYFTLLCSPVLQSSINKNKQTKKKKDLRWQLDKLHWLVNIMWSDWKHRNSHKISLRIICTQAVWTSVMFW